MREGRCGTEGAHHAVGHFEVRPGNKFTLEPQFEPPLEARANHRQPTGKLTGDVAADVEDRLVVGARRASSDGDRRAAAGALGGGGQ
jgi:hypothetical protein